MSIFRNTEALWRILLIILIILSSIFLLNMVWQGFLFYSDIIILFVVAWLIAFVLSPISRWLQKRRLSRVAAVGIVYLALTVVLFTAIILIVPLISSEIGQVANRFSKLATLDNLRLLSAEIIGRLKSFGLSDQDAHNIVNQGSSSIQQNLQSVLASLVNNAASLLASLASILLNMFIVLILSFYIMLDGRRILNSITQFLPTPWLSIVEDFEGHVARVFGGFVRGQLIISFLYGLFTWIALALLGMTNGFIFSLASALFMLIPFAGAYLSIIPPVILVLIDSDSTNLVERLIILFIALFIAQQVVLQVLAPRIMGQSIGLHPLWIFAALLVGAKEAGVWGAFFAAPVAALLAVMLKEFFVRYENRRKQAETLPDIPASGDDTSAPLTQTENTASIVNG